jgi:hypothetical protein
MFYPGGGTTSIYGLAIAASGRRIEPMVKPGREGVSQRPRVRRRHRTWMRSMIFATAAWGVFWSTAVIERLSEGWAPPLQLVYWISTPLAIAGFLMAVLTVRSQRSWLLFVSVPLFANGFLLLLLWLMPDAVETLFSMEPRES